MVSRLKKAATAPRVIREREVWITNSIRMQNKVTSREDACGMLLGENDGARQQEDLTQLITQ